MSVKKTVPACLLAIALFLPLSSPAFSQVKRIPGIEYIKQSDRNYCGAAALAMLLNYWSKDKKYTESEIVAALYNEKTRMIYNSDMVYFSRQQGFSTCSFNSTVEEIKKIIDLDIPVIVLQKPVKRVKKGHYRIVFGYDDTWEIFFVHDPMMGANRGIKYEEFRELWHFGDNPNQHNWTLAVFTEEKESVFPEVADSYVHHLNMATALYKRKSYETAIEEWEKASELDEQKPQAYYCLAQVLLDTGDVEEALVYARKAVAAGADDPFAYDVLGLVCYEKGMYFEAAEAMVKAMKLKKKNHTFIMRHWLEIRKNYISWNKEKKM